MKKSDLERLKKIVSTWAAAEAQIRQRGITREALMEDAFTQWALTTPLYNIGEQVYKLSTELKSQYPDVPWAVVSGLRHRLVHDYEGINWSVIVEVIFDEMPLFAERVRRICKEQAPSQA
ncbi:MAG: DUF86 domain-containing protein [Oscillospiraceae bacterium]|nr:DUF86 domain-containing protein [Oscillospiraceae bacterium]